jgi:hypothetical protein
MADSSDRFAAYGLALGVLVIGCMWLLSRSNFGSEYPRLGECARQTEETVGIEVQGLSVEAGAAAMAKATGVAVRISDLDAKQKARTLAASSKGRPLIRVLRDVAAELSTAEVAFLATTGTAAGGQCEAVVMKKTWK